jgi:signal peptidase II
MNISRKARYFWPLLFVLVLTDCTTKDLIVERLGADHGPRPVLDGFVRFTLAHNDGMAFGTDLRPYLGSGVRPALIGMMLLMIMALVQLYRGASPRSRLAGAALGLAIGGAVGNLYDRVRFSAGVVDFIDVGIGAHRFWVFNVADAGITIGGILLALVLMREEHAKTDISRHSS